MRDRQVHLRLEGMLRVIGLVVAVALALLGAGPARADTPVFGDPLWFGSGGDFAQAAAVGDVDGDGDLDLVIGGRTGRVVVYSNDGAGNYQRSFDFGAGRSAIIALALADLNGDGYLDVVTGSAGQNYVYLNQRGNRDLPSSAEGGPALYGPSTTLGAANEATLALAIGDVTGDGQHDIVVANDGQDYLYPGDGAGGFAPPVSLGVGAERSTSVVLVDLDRRNGLDVAVGSSGQTVLLYNQGDRTLQSRSLTDASATGRRQWVHCPVWLCREDHGPVQGTVERFDERHVAAADLNGDSHPDLIEVTDDSRLRVFLADARGSFLPPRELRAASETLVTSAVAAGDIDGDGRIDIVTTHPFAQNTVYLGAGQGEFGPGIGVGSDFDKTRGAALADIDGDRDVDLIFVNDTQPGVIYRNDGAGELVLAHQFGSGLEKPSDAKLVDLNGDGYLDLLVAQDGRPAGWNAVYLHGGAGRTAADPIFLPPARLGGSDVRTTAAVAGNFDQNPLPDVVLANFAQPSQLLFNVQGCRAGEACSAESRALDEQRRLALDGAAGDLDGDGHLDVVLAIQGGRNVVFLNDGSGGFRPAREVGAADLSTQSIALGDVDGDGDLDIVAGT
ncbi:MAG: VCBS repeat-containing protein, partial [Caldilinea sp.]